MLNAAPWYFLYAYIESRIENNGSVPEDKPHWVVGILEYSISTLANRHVE